MSKDKGMVLNLLHEGWVRLEFTKLDGTTRLMTATLAADQLPAQTQSTSETPRKKNDEVLAVWDVAKNSWRSFRWDSLKTVDGVPFVNT